MAISDLSERLARWPVQNKIGVVLGLVLVLGGAYYYFFFSELDAKSTRLDRDISRLEAEKSRYEDKKQNYMRLRAEVKKLLQRKKELIKQLPTQAEIPSFLQSLHAQAELADLNILTFDRKPERRKAFYAVIPVWMAISGTYHQISKFFYSVGRLKRIVNIHNVTLTSPRLTDKGVMLRARFIAATFRFIDSKPAPRRRRRRR